MAGRDFALDHVIVGTEPLVVYVVDPPTKLTLEDRHLVWPGLPARREPYTLVLQAENSAGQGSAGFSLQVTPAYTAVLISPQNATVLLPASISVSGLIKLLPNSTLSSPANQSALVRILFGGVARSIPVTADSQGLFRTAFFVQTPGIYRLVRIFESRERKQTQFQLEHQ